MTAFQRAKQACGETRSRMRHIRVLKRARSKAVRRAAYGTEKIVLRFYKGAWDLT